MADTDEGFLDDELTPPSAERVAKRALVMSAVVYRAFLEPYANEPDMEIHCQEVLIWLKRLNLLEELEANEQEILNAPPGQLDARQAIDGTWRSEGLVILAWALNRFDLPGYDKLVDPKELTDSLKFLSDEAENLLVSPRLREQNQLEQYAERIFALHWRLQEFSLHPKRMDFQKFAKEASFGPLDVSGLRFIDNDLAIGESDIANAPEEEFYKCVSITVERHQAANWLLGYDEIYSAVDTST